MLRTDRKTHYQIRDVFLAHRSLHVFLDEQVSTDDFTTLLGAAHWTQNSYNNQPYRFVHAKKNSSAWQRFVNFLVPVNQVWATNAQVLVMDISKKTFDYDGKSAASIHLILVLHVKVWHC